jgi:8-oxo-dGTP diphosphatase
LNQATMHERSVIAAVIQRNGHYLVCQRPMNKSHGGMWEFPGGKIEAGETIRDAADRELKEELNLCVLSIGNVRLSILDSASGYVINFVDVEADGDPALFEHTAFLWLLPGELNQVRLAPTDQQFAKRLLDKDD